MKLKLLIVTLLLAVTHSLYAQTANDWVKKAVEKNHNKDYKGAIADCNTAIELDGKNGWAYNNRGFAKICLGRYADAIAPPPARPKSQCWSS